MLVGDLRSYDKPANVVEAERIGLRAANDDDASRARNAVRQQLHRQPANRLLDQIASLGLTLVLAVVLFLAVTALAQAGLPRPAPSLAAAVSAAPAGN